jgi:hypothetical protein
MNRLLFLFIALFGFLVLGGVLLAQTPTPTEPVSCEPDDLIERQNDLQALLAATADDIDADTDAALAQLYEVGQAYQTLALECGYIPPDAGDLYVGEDVERILAVLETLNGDPLNGQLIYNSIEVAADGTVLGCSGCHINVEIAPLTEGTWTRWDETRSEQPQFEDYTFEQYMVESIVHPWEYTVPGYPENTMPNNYGDRLNYQNLADLITFLNSQDQLID